MIDDNGGFEDLKKVMKILKYFKSIGQKKSSIWGHKIKIVPKWGLPGCPMENSSSLLAFFDFFKVVKKSVFVIFLLLLLFENRREKRVIEF
jgi:hypothetical protein